MSGLDVSDSRDCTVKTVMADVIDRWFIQSPARYFLKVPALSQTISNDGFSDGSVLTNHLARQVGSICVFSKQNSLWRL